jgi:hypothetical protein
LQLIYILTFYVVIRSFVHLMLIELCFFGMVIASASADFVYEVWVLMSA